MKQESAASYERISTSGVKLTEVTHGADDSSDSVNFVTRIVNTSALYTVYEIKLEFVLREHATGVVIGRDNITLDLTLPPGEARQELIRPYFSGRTRPWKQTSLQHIITSVRAK